MNTHKVQGLSLTNIVASFQLLKQRNFNYGQTYAALSRIKSPNGLYVLGYFSVNSVRSGPRELEEHDRMQLESSLSIFETKNLHESSLTVSLLNVKSLKKHLANLICDERLLKNDLICLMLD